jgi:hypothetical protein
VAHHQKEVQEIGFLIFFKNEYRKFSDVKLGFCFTNNLLQLAVHLSQLEHKYHFFLRDAMEWVLPHIFS